MRYPDHWVPCYPEFPNISCFKAPYSADRLLYEIGIYCLSVFTVVLNLFTIISVSHFRQLHTPTNTLLLSLAVSDFLLGLLVMPLDVKQVFRCWFFGILGCALFKFCTGILHIVSIGNIMLISVDRYVAICDPLHYTARITVKRTKVSVCLLWLYSLVFYARVFFLHIIQLYYHPVCIGACISLASNVGTGFQMVLNVILPITVIIVLYMRVFIVALSQARAMRSHITDVKKQLSVTKTAKKSELKAARTLGVLVVVFLMCLLPSYIAGFFYSNTSVSYLMFIHFFYNLNSCLNPVIYALFYPLFRKAVKLIVSLQILQPGSSEANIL